MMNLLKGMKSQLTELGVELLIRILDGQISDEAMVQAGYKSGRWVSENAKSRIGKSWNSMEDVMQDKAQCFFTGLNQGLDKDD